MEILARVTLFILGILSARVPPVYTVPYRDAAVGVRDGVFDYIHLSIMLDKPNRSILKESILETAPKN